MGILIESVLLWHRIEWGFEEWVHEVAFFNFWHGTYAVMAGENEIEKIIRVNIKQFDLPYSQN